MLEVNAKKYSYESQFCGKWYLLINHMCTNFTHLKICLTVMPLLLLQSRYQLILHRAVGAGTNLQECKKV